MAATDQPDGEVTIQELADQLRVLRVLYGRQRRRLDALEAEMDALRRDCFSAEDDRGGLGGDPW